MLYTNLPLSHIPNVSSEEAHAGALRILFLNIMPIKPTTEEDFARSLAFADVDVELLPMKIANQQYKCTPQEYVERYYRDFEVYADGHYDGLIITGAPLENIPFEEVRYWPQLTQIMAWAQTHVSSSLYVCWGAQAALYYHFSIPKYALPQKMFGIFQHQAMMPHPLLNNLSPTFPMPHSRHTEVRANDFPAECHILAQSAESGVGLACAHGIREIFITGHLEYEPHTLHNEYLRDLSKNLPILPPKHYYKDGDTQNGVDYSWHVACQTFFHNWLMQVKKGRD
ncbi:MAG: homoserine O-succinyltransferase [Bacteroidaceae bacterium]|nr:homoserine O-succinyltransferase [Bacteroidaceae bacterium]